MNDYRIILQDLPCTIHAFVRMATDGTYTIVLNSRLSREMQEEALKHELEHIKHDDFYSPLTADRIEADRHG